jgi:hypothetical protein
MELIGAPFFPLSKNSETGKTLMLNKQFLVSLLAVATAMTTMTINAPSSYAVNPVRNAQQAGKAAKYLTNLGNATKNGFKKGQTAVKKYGKGAKGAYKLNSKACKQDNFRNSSPTCKK